MILKNLNFSLLALALVAGIENAAAFPETVKVGDPGNKADTTGYGAVAYAYQIGKYEVTNAEYCAFLNAVAKNDPHKLFTNRADGAISRSGDSGNYTYTVSQGSEKKPVGHVTFQCAVRYVNWLSNGKAAGDTEKGSYTIENEQVKVPDHAALAAAKGVKWVIPSENEWYKAAYYDAGKAGGAGYWKFPAKSDRNPAANINSNILKDVGSYADVVSAYGTFDQGGNVWEYNDNQSGDKVGLRGSSFYIHDQIRYMQSGARYDVVSTKVPHYGFRVAALGTVQP
jgi:sulfatase modifying factor 1